MDDEEIRRLIHKIKDRLEDAIDLTLNRGCRSIIITDLELSLEDLESIKSRLESTNGSIRPNSEDPRTYSAYKEPHD